MLVTSVNATVAIFASSAVKVVIRCPVSTSSETFEMAFTGVITLLACCFVGTPPTFGRSEELYSHIPSPYSDNDPPVEPPVFML